MVQRSAANAQELRALVDVRRGDRAVGQLEPGRNFYPAEQQTSSEMAIHRDWKRAEDLDLILQHYDAASGTIELKALVKPLVNLIWLAGLVFLGGSLIALWPDAREQRRLAARYARSSVAAPA